MKIEIQEIVNRISGQFSTFGGGKSKAGNFLSMALEDKPAMFAAGVDVEDVVRAVIESLDR